MLLLIQRVNNIRQTLLISIFSLLHFTALISADFPYQLDSLTTDHGLSNNAVFCIYQDSRGFVWIGTKYGLNRFDGNVFKTYFYSPEDSTSLSNNYVWDILEDRHGNFWIGTASGLNRYNRIEDNFQRYTLQGVRSDSIRRVAVRVIFEDSHGVIWLGTTNGLERYDRRHDRFTHYSIYLNGNENLRQNFVLSIYEDQTNRLWVGTRKGLFKYDPGSDCLLDENELSQHFERIDISFSSILQDRTGTLWLGTWSPDFCLNLINFNRQSEIKPVINQILLYAGVYDLYEDHFSRIWVGTDSGLLIFMTQNFPPDNFLLRKKYFDNQKIRCILEDKSGIIWVGTEWHGIYRFIPRLKKFENFEIPLDKSNQGRQSRISAICEDENEFFWIGTLGNNLWGFNRRKREFIPFKNISGVDIYPYINSLLLDDQRQLWIGTYFYAKLMRYDLVNNKLVAYPADSSANSISGLTFTALFQAHNGLIWIGTDDSGLYLFDKTKNEFIHFQRDPQNPSSLSTNRISAIHEDQTGQVWIGTGGGGLNKYLPEENKFIHYRRNRQCKTSLSDDILFSIHEDHSGILWIGTANGGLNRFDPATGIFEHFGLKDGFPSNRIYGILEDSSGNLWISSSRGLSKFNPKTKAIRNYDKSDGLPDNEFDKASYLKCKSGELIFGGRNGFTIFHPDSLLDNRYIPPVYLTDFKILNKPATLDTIISEKKQLQLTYDQNVFSFEFAALNYINPGKNQYQYKMEGFDKNWQKAWNRRYASYSNLAPGNYTFRVKASNNDGFWNHIGTAVSITVLPPWWRTKLAYLIYVTLIGFIILGFYRFILYRAKIRNELAMQRFEANEMREIDEMKSHFFANISHEFRTPLTLIIGPIEDFLADLGTAEHHNIFKIMHRNAKRLQKLINQLLDLSRLETGSTKLRLKPKNVTALIKAQVNSFLSLAKREKIKFQFDTSENDIFGNIDPDILEKIVSNLLSNAFKFTLSGGEITVQLKKIVRARQNPNEAREYLALSVADNGIGIPAEKQNDVFKRFYQISTSMTRAYEGSGIGLSLAKELVELHGGEIYLESELNQGTTFFVRIPLDKGAVEGTVGYDDSNSEIQEIDFSESDQIQSQNEPQQIIPENKTYRTVLVVDDNNDVRNYIGDCLQQRYKILYAANGQQALTKATAKMPDLIVSDVMMPLMDGFELCRQIKSNEYTSHIPVILLTAKASEENKLEGLETGADDYLIKPFNKTELKIRAKNLIEQRERLRKRFSKEIGLNPANVSVSSMDEKFLARAIEIVKSRLSDESFSVDFFSREIGMSRQHLNRKLKALTDFATRDFIRCIRLKQAALLIKTKSATVTEIAYEVGFRNPSYFTECFKKQFGIPPSDYHKPA